MNILRGTIAADLTLSECLQTRAPPSTHYNGFGPRPSLHENIPSHPLRVLQPLDSRLLGRFATPRWLLCSADDRINSYLLAPYDHGHCYRSAGRTDAGRVPFA
ncbi:hypothetical protein HYQ46_007133 [Verticillium longisporum]|nr:hypothetical protein HYQ46_007133 [Verticillium longisporum]